MMHTIRTWLIVSTLAGRRSTDFNFYARLWAGWIIKDIQNNILQVIQTRCQQNL